MPDIHLFEYLAFIINLIDVTLRNQRTLIINEE